MLEKILANPGGFVGGCLVWIPVAIWVIMAVSWMVMGEADVIPGVACIMVAFCLGYFTSNPPTPIIGHILLATAVLSLAMVPVVRHVTRRHMLDAIHEDQIAQFCDTLRQRPNPGTEYRIAQALWDQGDIRRAVAIAHRVMPSMAIAVFGTEHREYQSWLMRSRLDPAALVVEAYACSQCSHRCSLASVFCPACGNSVVLAQAKSANNQIVKQILVGWSLVVGLLIATPLIGVALPVFIAVPLIIAILVGSGFILIRLIGREITT